MLNILYIVCAALIIGYGWVLGDNHGSEFIGNIVHGHILEVVDIAGSEGSQSPEL